jgi:uncharacterized DUF497 family protein
MYTIVATLPKCSSRQTKRAANLLKHALDLMDGGQLFDGRPVFTYPSPRHEEIRVVTVGVLSDQHVAVVWTERELAVRLICLRRARNAEKRAYSAIFG